MNKSFMDKLQDPKNKKTLQIIGIIVAVVIVGGAIWYSQAHQKSSNLVGGEYAVAGITNAFGANLKMVSLLADKDDVAASMDIHYKPFVTPELLAEWKADPTLAPGRQTSSPFPDKIEVASVSKINSRTYKVTGNVLEVANGTKGSTQVVSVYPITLTYKNFDGTWLITELEKGQPAAASKNDDAGGDNNPGADDEI
jgi:hypothetical protein